MSSSTQHFPVYFKFMWDLLSIKFFAYVSDYHYARLLSQLWFDKSWPCLASLVFRAKLSDIWFLLGVQPVAELIKEIAILEYEVMYLEQYLLSLYRKAFDQQIPPLRPSNKEKRMESPLDTPRGSFLELPRHNIVALRGKNVVVQSGCESLTRPSKDCEVKPLDSIHRCRSSLLERSAQTSPLLESAAKALRPCQSQPVSMMEASFKASLFLYLIKLL